MENLTSKLIIETVKVINTQLFGIHYPTKSLWVTNSREGRSLLVNGTLENGQKVWFFTPTAEVMVAEGMLNYIKLSSNTPWLKESEGEMIGHPNPLYYEKSEANGWEGSFEMPVGIENTAKIIPAVEVGQTISLQYKVKRECKNKTLQLYYTKLLEVIN